MKSSWDTTRANSNYHFDSTRQDRMQDVLTVLGNVPVTWQDDLEQIIEQSKPASWATRGYKSPKFDQPQQELAAEEYDLERVGADPKMIITNLNWQIPPSLQALSDCFALDDCMNRIHVQFPGQVWNLHLDKLQKWCRDDPSKVGRYFIQLTDWQPGQFWEYGNFHWNQWSAGNVTTFDWKNIPHSTANAGHHPRATLQITGVITERTTEFLQSLKAQAAWPFPQ